MPSPILNQIPDNNSELWAAKIQHLWADHYSLLRAGFEVKQVTLTKHQCGKFEGDFYGLLTDVGVPVAYHPYVTFFNSMSHPCQYKSTMETILIPDFSELGVIAKINNTVNI